MLPTKLLRVRTWSHAMLGLLRSRWSNWKIRLGTWLLGRDMAAPQPSAADVLSAGMRRPGVGCPRCGTLIAVTIANLLSGEPTVCPNVLCGLRLEVDREKSSDALAALATHVDALHNICELESPRLQFQWTNLKWPAGRISEVSDKQP